MKRMIATVAACWVAFAALPSIPGIRAYLAAPLVVTDDAAAGDACYVMAAGNALWERLAAASDLYHMKRTRTILLMQSGTSGPFNFTARASWNQTQWAVDYLAWRGVPKDHIRILGEITGLFGTLKEARNVAKNLSPEIKALVLVTSPAHTRRSLLAFRKSLPRETGITPYAATAFEHSAERYEPIWLEYLKLLAYKIYLLR